MIELRISTMGCLLTARNTVRREALDLNLHCILLGEGAWTGRLG